MKKNNTKKHRLKQLMLLLIFVVCLIIAGLGYIYTTNNKNKKSTTEINNPNDSAQINLSPPSEQEKQAGNETKAKYSGQSSNLQTKTPTVIPIISDAGFYGENLEVSSFVPGIYENGGTCILTAVSGSSTITKSVKAEEDATVVRCVNFILPKTEFKNGDWKVTVKYLSTTHNGESESKVIKFE